MVGLEPRSRPGWEVIVCAQAFVLYLSIRLDQAVTIARTVSQLCHLLLMLVFPKR